MAHTDRSSGARDVEGVGYAIQRAIRARLAQLQHERQHDAPQLDSED